MSTLKELFTKLGLNDTEADGLLAGSLSNDDAYNKISTYQNNLFEKSDKMSESNKHLKASVLKDIEKYVISTCNLPIDIKFENVKDLIKLALKHNEESIKEVYKKEVDGKSSEEVLKLQSVLREIETKNKSLLEVELPSLKNKYESELQREKSEMNLQRILEKDFQLTVSPDVAYSYIRDSINRSGNSLVYKNGKVNWETSQGNIPIINERLVELQDFMRDTLSQAGLLQKSNGNNASSNTQNSMTLPTNPINTNGNNNVPAHILKNIARTNADMAKSNYKLADKK